MKKTMLFGIVAVLVAALMLGNTGLFPQEVVAASDTTQNTVSVNGVGEITVKPDVAYITIGVETEDKDASVAQADNSAKMDKVLKAIKALGIKEDEIKTTQYSVYDRYDYFDNDDSEKYYVVTNTVQVTVTDVTIVGDVVDAATTAGSNQVSNIQFGISNEDEVYQEALKLAMESAKNKANSIASTFGKSVSVPVNVSETSYYSGAVRGNFEMMAMDAKAATPISTGELTISAQVSVEYNY